MKGINLKIHGVVQARPGWKSMYNRWLYASRSQSPIGVILEIWKIWEIAETGETIREHFGGLGSVGHERENLGGLGSVGHERKFWGGLGSVGHERELFFLLTFSVSAPAQVFTSAGDYGSLRLPLRS